MATHQIRKNLDYSKQRGIISRSQGNQRSRKRKPTIDQSPMRRVNSYSSPERFYDYPSLVRRASLEHLYSSSQYYPSSNRFEEYPRRWSDDYSYGRSSFFPHQSHGGRLSPRQQDFAYDAYGGHYNKKYSGGSSGKELTYSRNRDYYDDYNYTSRNKDYYNDYSRSDRKKYDQHQYYPDKPIRRNTNPNIRKYLLTRDPKDKRISGNGLGMKVVGGKEIPGTNSRLGAYIAKITPGGVVSTLGELKEGNLIVEWNGRNLLDRTYEEVQKVISQTADEVEVEISVRSDIDMLSEKPITNTQLQELEASIYDQNISVNKRNEDYYYSSQNYPTAKRHNGQKRPPFDPLDINGNEADLIMKDGYQYLPEDDGSRYRDPYRSKSYNSKLRYCTEDGKENYPYRDDRQEADFYNDPYSSRRGYRYGDDDYLYYDRDYQRSRRRSFELKESRYYSPRDRSLSPDMRHRNHYRETRSYSPERFGRSYRDRPEYDRRDDSIPGHNNSLNLPRPLHSTPSSPNLTSSDSPRRRILPKTSNNQRSSNNHQNYRSDQKPYNQNSNSRQKTSRDSKSQSGYPKSNKETRHHSKGGTRNSSKKGKYSKQGSGGSSKQDQSHTPLGQVELQVCFDSQASILYVTVIRARGLLTLRDDGDTCPDPFVKVYLLPGRSIENQRRTRHFCRTSSPEWNQTMVYPNIQAVDLKKRYLEVTAWNYDKHKPNEFLGEVVLDLSDPMVVDEEPKWYQLQEMEDPEAPPSISE